MGRFQPRLCGQAAIWRDYGRNDGWRGTNFITVRGSTGGICAQIASVAFSPQRVSLDFAFRAANLRNFVIFLQVTLTFIFNTLD
jgi:hypothetical protein